MSPAISVYVEEFSTREESRREVASFSSYDLRFVRHKCVCAVCMREFLRRGQSAKELFELWVIFGEDVYIVPDERQPGFSAVDYGRWIAMELACDHGDDLIVQVVCEDRINSSSGCPSQPGDWTFWITAPPTFSGQNELFRRSVELLYNDMSRKASAGDGSTYTLLKMNLHELSAAEAAAWKGETGKRSVFLLQPDGTLQEPDQQRRKQ